jgi:hypothetical protein
MLWVNDWHCCKICAFLLHWFFPIGSKMRLLLWPAKYPKAQSQKLKTKSRLGLPPRQEWSVAPVANAHTVFADRANTAPPTLNLQVINQPGRPQSRCSQHHQCVTGLRGLQVDLPAGGYVVGFPACAAQGLHGLGFQACDVGGGG